jgi:putative LysE/RhtB family amino acid efflux pump
MNFALSKEKGVFRNSHSAVRAPADARTWLERIVADLFLIGFGIGMIVAAPIGPIGTATLVEAIAGNYTAAFAAMAGCVCAEFGLLLIAVFGVVHLNATSLALPNVVHLSVGLAFLLVGLYYLTAKRISPVGGVTTFVIAFKITLFSPNNLAALVAAIVAMGVAARLSSFGNDAAFAAGEFSGVVVCWLSLVGLAALLQRKPLARRAIPWLRKGVGVVMMAAGLIIIVVQIQMLRPR